MKKPQTTLEKTHHSAKELHKKSSANVAKAEHATLEDLKVVQADAKILVAEMTNLAGEQADSVKSGITSAIGKLEAAGKLVENKTTAARDDIAHANVTMMEGAHKAAQGLSAAIAAFRSRIAQAIAPK